MQQVFTAASTSCHAGRGLAGHPRCFRVGNDYSKMKLYSPIRSKTTAHPRCARHRSAQRGRWSPPRRGDESAWKRSHINRSSRLERVRLLQPLLPCPHSTATTSSSPKRRWPATYSKSPLVHPDENLFSSLKRSCSTFFNTARTNGRTVSLHDYKKPSVEEEKIVFPIQASSTQYSFYISGNRGYDSNRVCYLPMETSFNSILLRVVC